LKCVEIGHLDDPRKHQDVLILARNENGLVKLYLDIFPEDDGATVHENVRSLRSEWAAYDYLHSFDVIVWADKYAKSTRERIQRMYGAPGYQVIDFEEIKLD
jgi:hypothetical protein